MKREKAVQELALRKAVEKEKAAGNAAAKVDKAAKERQKGGKMAQSVRPATKEDPVAPTDSSGVKKSSNHPALKPQTSPLVCPTPNGVRYPNSAHPVPVWDTPHSKRVLRHGRHFIVNVVEIDDKDVSIRSISPAVARVLTEKVALNPRFGMDSEEENQNQLALKKGTTVNSERSRSQNVEPSSRSLNPRSGMTSQPTRSKGTKSKQTGSRNIKLSQPPAKPAFGAIDGKDGCG